MQLVKSNCSLTLEQKRAYLLECANSDYFQRKYDEYIHGTKLNQKTVLFGLVKARQVRLTLVFGKLIRAVRGK